MAMVMAAAELSGPGMARRKRLPSIEGLCHSPLRSMVLSSSSVGFDLKCYRGLTIKAPVGTSHKLSVSFCLNGSRTKTPVSDSNTVIEYAEDETEQPSYSTDELVDGKAGTDIHKEHQSAIPAKRSAKIHDFCLGIPFGGFIFSAGLFGFLFSRNPTSLTTGVLSGGAILALSIGSLKVWRKGRSSLPFILGQAAIAAVIFRKHFQLYSTAKGLFPSMFYIVISAAMICFYLYVMVSGGNPPPKKLRAAPPS